MTSSFFSTPALLPVIHVKDNDTAKANAELALRAGCSGVFLICHDDDDMLLWEAFDAVKDEFEDLWVGINLLGARPINALCKVRDSEAEGLWTDGIDDDQENDQVMEDLRRGWNGVYFGGVAFKYQPIVTGLSAEVRRKNLSVDVVTTSGAGTGEAPNPEKIRTMREALPKNRPLAIASGITPENINDYLPYAQVFLVATGISKDFHNFDPAKLNALAKIIYGWTPRA